MYDLKDIEIPSLAGPALRAFTTLIETRMGRTALLPSLMKTFGVDRFRNLELTERPSPVPLFARPRAPGADDRPTAVTEDFLSSRWCDAKDRGEKIPGILEYAEAYRNGATDPVRVAEALVDAYQDSSGGPTALRALVHFDEADLMAQAKASADRLAKGKPLSVFDGVPVAIKDELDMVPFPTGAGTEFLGVHPAVTDATSVARIRATGAMLIGKTHMHEIGIGVTGINAHHGPARNPYDVTRIAGGSSSGSAVAVAAGLSPVALGADGGGSIRIPAALCGIVGLKPTFGRVSESGAFPLCWSMGHIGPMGWYARDVALTYALLAGPDPRDPWSAGHPAPRLPRAKPEGIAGLRIGVYHEWFEHADPSVVKACWNLLSNFEDRGATIVPVEIPDLDATRLAHVVTILVEMAGSLHGVYRRRRQAFGLDTRVNLVIANAFTGADYLQAQRMRTRAVNHFLAVLGKVDVIATPASPVPAPPIPEQDLPEGRSDLGTTTMLMRYMGAGNLTGLPAITFPAGYGDQGLPMGLQMMGRPWEEDMLLRFALIADALVPRRRPERYYDLMNGNPTQSTRA